MDRLIMQKMRAEVDEKYVGFRPNSGSIKPVHISSGAFRAILGETFSAEGIKKLSYVSNAKGEAPDKRQTLKKALESVIQYLKENDVADFTEIGREQLASFRSVLQKLVDVDKGVYGVKDNMLSYTAGSRAFVTSKGILEDAGDFVGELIKTYCPEISMYIASVLREAKDPISLVFEPVLELGTTSSYEFNFTDETPLDKIKAFEKPDKLSEEIKRFVANISDAGRCLKANMEQHSNRLTQLRLFNLFCILLVIRYLSLLEAFYCGGSVRPILLDFSKGNNSSVSRTSVLCYSQLHKSISRFYAWAYSEWLIENGCDKKELLCSDVPYFDKDKEPKSLDGLTSVWSMAKEDAKNASNEEASLIFGAAINDMTALEATSHPVNYMRKLGTEIGLLYPPTNFHVDKRFVLSDDMVEVILRCCVLPGETLTSSALRENLWNRFGIVIGGSDDDVEKLNRLGSIVYADADALVENWNSFSDILQSMNFAEQLPDGILQIGFGGRRI